jgi:hypothetical protein
MKRLRPTVAEKALGRMAACSIDSYNFFKGHRPKRQFMRYVLKEVRELEARLVLLNRAITGVD